MKVTLSFEYEIQEEDGVGTSNDATSCAFSAMYCAVQEVNATDDILNYFTVTIHNEEL